MAVTIDVDYRVLEGVATEWGVATDDLAGAADRLRLVSGAGLSPLVCAEVDAFARRWQQEIHALAELARSGRAALELAGGDYRITDRHLAEEIRSLMPWGQRHDRIRQG